MVKSPSVMSPPTEAKKTVDAVNSTPVSSRSGELEEVKRQLAATLKQNAELSKQDAEMTKQVTELTKQVTELLSRADRSDRPRDNAERINRIHGLGRGCGGDPGRSQFKSGG